jgi:1-acyl-sn-glycerol-3-phosphate acyltransferase
MILRALKFLFSIPWTLWCALVFLVLNAFFFPFLFILIAIGSQRCYRWAHHVPTIIGRLSLILWGVRIETSGRENFDPSAQYIFVGNHRSMLDALVSGGFIYNPKKFIGKAEILNWPFLGYILRKLYIPVKRDNKESRKWSREQLILKMNEGFSMVIFAEGKTNATDEPLLPFKSGAFSAACDSQVSIVPFIMYGADKIWHRKTWLISPGKLKLKFLIPIISPPSTEENIDEMREYVYDLILDNYNSFIYSDKG